MVLMYPCISLNRGSLADLPIPGSPGSFFEGCSKLKNIIASGTSDKVRVLENRGAVTQVRIAVGMNANWNVPRMEKEELLERIVGW